MSKKSKQTKLIPAVAYCRKSTNEERTEKSIADQTARIKKLTPLEDGAKYEVVRWYTHDKGVPGWKRGANRPDYFKLVNELKETGARAILVDDMDRFSRADEFEVMQHVQELRENHRVRYIHAVNQGSVDLVEDQFAAMKIAMSAMAGHEFSTRLSRRIANARLDAAKLGKRSGGEAPYGMANDGQAGLKPGDPKEVKVVRWVFEQFVKRLKSMNWIAAQLNIQGTPARHGGKWYVKTIKELLERQEYKGAFSYNAKKSGQFNIVNGKHEVVRITQYHDEKPKPWQKTDEGRIIRQGVYKPIIDPKLFDTAQRRLAAFALKGSRRPRADGFPLSRILICDHCQKFMYGCKPTGRKQRVYRCSTNAKTGSGTCGNYWIDEGVILPAVLRMLGEEMKDLEAKLTAPPEELRHPNKHRAEERATKEREREQLAKLIARAEEDLFLMADARNRQALDRRLTEARDKLERLDADLAEEPAANGYTTEQIAALGKWWEEFTAKAVSVPVSGGVSFSAHWFLDPAREEPSLLMDARVVNEALHALGAEVRLRWNTERVTLPSGKQQNRYSLVGGRFRLGQQSGKISGKNGVTLCKARSVAACNGSSAARRPDNRRGKDSAPRST